MVYHRKMTGLGQRLQEPETIISLVAFIFSLWTVWATLNNRIKELEGKMEEVDAIDIKTKLAEIQTDLTWIKAKLDEK